MKCSYLLWICTSSFSTFGQFYIHISRLWDLARSCGKPPRHLINLGTTHEIRMLGQKGFRRSRVIWLLFICLHLEEFQLFSSSNCGCKKLRHAHKSSWQTFLSPAKARCVCLCVSVCVCHDVCPDYLTMKNWCPINNILQVHSWWVLVVQVIFHALMASSMTSPGQKVGQLLKLLYLHQYFS